MILLSCSGGNKEVYSVLGEEKRESEQCYSNREREKKRERDLGKIIKRDEVSCDCQLVCFIGQFSNLIDFLLMRISVKDLPECPLLLFSE